MMDAFNLFRLTNNKTLWPHIDLILEDIVSEAIVYVPEYVIPGDVHWEIFSLVEALYDENFRGGSQLRPLL